MPNFGNSSVITDVRRGAINYKTIYMQRLENKFCGYKKPDVEIIAVMAEYGFAQSSKNEGVGKDDEIDFY